ncbi:hypothetical protein SAMN05216241_103137 [Limimonas halophila]|uniref:Uncharacterized protein n=1 Tax=Limimonas halophila TaxID=1082479 RepID=A0A1G7PYJ5_9PROT|nr:hypothetical protein SAMN05216241_103137 [Limimonas halophila]
MIYPNHRGRYRRVPDRPQTGQKTLPGYQTGLPPARLKEHLAHRAQTGSLQPGAPARRLTGVDATNDRIPSRPPQMAFGTAARASLPIFTCQRAPRQRRYPASSRAARKRLTFRDDPAPSAPGPPNLCVRPARVKSRLPRPSPPCAPPERPQRTSRPPVSAVCKTTPHPLSNGSLHRSVIFFARTDLPRPHGAFGVLIARVRAARATGNTPGGPSGAPTASRAFTPHESRESDHTEPPIPREGGRG